MVQQQPPLDPEVLLGDFLTVQQAIAAPAVTALRDKILSGEASHTEIETRYRTFDALDAPTAFEDEADARRYLKAAGSIALADFIGGAQMVAETLLQGAVERSGGFDGILATLVDDDIVPVIEDQLRRGELARQDIDDWNTIVTYTHGAEDGALKILAERMGAIHFGRMIGMFGEDVTVTTTEALRAVSLGRTILNEGARGIRDFMNIQPDLFVRAPAELPVVASLHDIATDPNLQLGFNELILRSGSVLHSVEAKDILLDEVKRATGTTLSWPTSPDETYELPYLGGSEPVDLEQLPKFQEAIFIDAVRNVQVAANFARRHNTTMFQKGRIKGTLHEALWMLDAFAIRKGMPERFGNLFLEVSTEAEDMPFLDKPMLKRGYDFIIREAGEGNRDRRLIQVGAGRRKSSNKTEQPYNPKIEVYCEAEFNEVNLTTLDGRLQRYVDWAAAGFSSDAFDRLKIAENVLGTVKECFGLET